MIEQTEYCVRRNKLFDLLDDHSISILFSGRGKKVSGDEFSYEVNKNFYYLTGIEQENSILMMVKSDDTRVSYLFVEEKDEKVEKWTGYRLTTKAAQEISGVENVLVRSTFDGKMMALLESNGSHFGEIDKFYLDLELELKMSDCKSTIQFKQELEAVYNLPVLDLHDKVTGLRMIKSPAEVDMIREAIKTTEYALNHVINELRPGLYEYSIRNIFNFNVFEDDNDTLAFPTIVAGGKNAIVLHYPSATDPLNDNECVLLDCGAANHHYCADISRTYPISGKFTQMQRIIYQIVLDCNKETAAFMRPGITLKEVNEFARNFLAEECFAKGLITSKDKIGEVYYHSVSHHLGLDTHDGTDRVSKLVPGNVITCEPGLYFKNLGIGVRIEDDVLITEEGSEVLSKSIIKEIADIERVFKR